MTVFNAISHASSRKATGLHESDYDHEISLIDHTTTYTSARSRSQSVGPESSRRDSLAPAEDETRRYSSDSNIRKKTSLRAEVERKRYSKYLDPREGHVAGLRINEEDGASIRTPSRASSQVRPSSRPQTRGTTQSTKNTPPESAIDILYENQRGGFLCGIPLFSSKALGALDAPPWTNIALKPSATDTTNATVPDPSWEWAWKEWRVNHGDDVDEDGWEYSFSFSKRFSWHGPTWWNSFVRRRAWIRKRVKVHSGYGVSEAHMLNPDYFTIHPHLTHSRSGSRADTNRDSRYSVTRPPDVEEMIEREEIRDISTLLKALRYSRIDREMTEAVENFIEHAEDELLYLSEHMHEIMSHFIFQASRQALLTHLSRLVDQAADEAKKETPEGEQRDSKVAQRIVNLEKAVEAADKEVKRLEYWSDIKTMAEAGDTKGAADGDQGWGSEWIGVDASAPKDVISNREMPGGEQIQGKERASDTNPDDSVNGVGNDKKGKGKA